MRRRLQATASACGSDAAWWQLLGRQLLPCPLLMPQERGLRLNHSRIIRTVPSRWNGSAERLRKAAPAVRWRLRLQSHASCLNGDARTQADQCELQMLGFTCRRWFAAAAAVEPRGAVQLRRCSRPPGPVRTAHVLLLRYECQEQRTGQLGLLLYSNTSPNACCRTRRNDVTWPFRCPPVSASPDEPSLSASPSPTHPGRPARSTVHYGGHSRVKPSCEAGILLLVEDTHPGGGDWGAAPPLQRWR